MQEKPKFLYHYTSLAALEAILESGTWRLYDAMRQKDTFEIIYAGNQVLSHYYRRLLSPEFKNTKNKKNIIIFLSVIYLSKYLSNDTNIKNFVDSKILDINPNSLFVEFYNDLQTRRIDFYISSFSINPNNEYLWKEYANDFQGIVIKFPTSVLPDSVGEKEVTYFTEKELEYFVELRYRLLDSESDDILKLFEINVHATVDSVLSLKQKKYEKEEEYRLIEYFETETNKQKIEFDDIAYRKYINLDIEKNKLRQALSHVYFSEQMTLENRSILSKIKAKYGLKIEEVKNETKS